MDCQRIEVSHVRCLYGSSQSFLLWKFWSSGTFLFLFSGSFIRFLCYLLHQPEGGKDVTH